MWGRLNKPSKQAQLQQQPIDGRQVSVGERARELAPSSSPRSCLPSVPSSGPAIPPWHAGRSVEDCGWPGRRIGTDR
ncbi:hypothetical protein SKAU_G00314450 [Synaphobranchus kaupii]|uniref:Uncharacterized protein n=1 Tax=Synaphobranchus kaupii TaxID=118154 RepID=A0A9Q1ESC7_SYNKA|nr:hypothetical protein SKAU_G00314450 [Synaphobranchus kaupii]